MEDVEKVRLAMKEVQPFGARLQLYRRPNSI